MTKRTGYETNFRRRNFSQATPHTIYYRLDSDSGSGKLIAKRFISGFITALNYNNIMDKRAWANHLADWDYLPHDILINVVRNIFVKGRQIRKQWELE